MTSALIKITNQFKPPYNSQASSAKCPRRLNRDEPIKKNNEPIKRQINASEVFEVSGLSTDPGIQPVSHLATAQSGNSPYASFR